MDVQRLTLTLHPAIIVAAYIAVFLSRSMTLLFILEAAALWWAWSLYSKASPTRFWGNAVFAIAATGLAAVLASESLPSAAQPTIMLGILPYFAANWLAAGALVKFESNAAPVPWWKVLVTFLQVFYLPIGIWFLRGRLQKLLA